MHRADDRLLRVDGQKGNKQGHFIHAEEDSLAAAGLTWTTEISGVRRRVFVVVTREARDASGEVHERMPAFRFQLLDELDASSTQVAATIRTHMVDRRVNNSRTVDPSDASLVEPVTTA
jgi:putative SOS response-associated peptidase YedK